MADLPRTYMATYGSASVVEVRSSLIVLSLPPPTLLTPMMLMSVTVWSPDRWITFTGDGVFVEIIVSPKIFNSTLLCAAPCDPTRTPSKNPAILTSSIELLEESRYTAAFAAVIAMQVSPWIPRPFGPVIFAHVVVERAEGPLSKVIFVYGPQFCELITKPVPNIRYIVTWSI